MKFALFLLGLSLLTTSCRSVKEIKEVKTKKQPKFETLTQTKAKETKQEASLLTLEESREEALAKLIKNRKTTRVEKQENTKEYFEIFKTTLKFVEQNHNAKERKKYLVKTLIQDFKTIREGREGIKVINPKRTRGRWSKRHYKSIVNLFVLEILEDTRNTFFNIALESIFADIENKNTELINDYVIDIENEETVRFLLQNMAAHFIKRGFETFLSESAFRTTRVLAEKGRRFFNIRKKKRLQARFSNSQLDSKIAVIKDLERALNVKDLYLLKGEKILIPSELKNLLEEVDYSNEVLKLDPHYRKLQLLVDRLLE